MSIKVLLQGRLQLKGKWLTIRREDGKNGNAGRLRVGSRKVQWIYPGKVLPAGEKTWEDLIKFIVSTP